MVFSRQPPPTRSSSMATSQASCSLDTLPKEVLLAIRDNIPSCSLSAHVRLSLTCRATFALYDNAYWEIVCANAGYGMNMLRPDLAPDVEREKQQMMPWGGLARIIATDCAYLKDFNVYNVICKHDRLQRQAGFGGDKKHTVVKDAHATKLERPLRILQVPTRVIRSKHVNGIFAVYCSNHQSNIKGHTKLLFRPSLANRFATIHPISELKIEGWSCEEEEYRALYIQDLREVDETPEAPEPIVLSNPGGVTIADVYTGYAEQHGYPLANTEYLDFVGWTLDGNFLLAIWKYEEEEYF